MGVYEDSQALIEQSIMEINNLLNKPVVISEPSQKMDIEPPKSIDIKNNIEDLNLMFGKGINLLEEYKLPEEPKKKGRRKKSEFNGSFKF